MHKKSKIIGLAGLVAIAFLLTAATYNEQKIYKFLSGILTDTIGEATADTGVTIESLKLKDGGFELGSDADGDLYYRSGGALERLGKGTALQVLRMNSGGTLPEWGTDLGTDSDAIHDNVAGEINAVSEKASPVSADLVLIEDSADSYNKKKVQLGNLPGGGGATAFTGLTDTPASYSGEAGKFVKVNSGETALEFSADILLKSIYDPASVAEQLAGLTATQSFSNKSIDADSNTITNIADDEIKASAGIDATKIGNGDVTSAELSYINSVTSNVQTQLDGKASSGANTDITSLQNTGLYVGRDTDNRLNWSTDDQLDIVIGGTTTSIVSVSTGTSDNDKLVTKGYVDDNAGGGSGDVTGPASSTDNAVARFDGTGGKTLQDSGVTIDDSNNIDTAGALSVDTISEHTADNGVDVDSLKIKDGGLVDLENLNFDNASELTIASGVVTKTQALHTIDGEGDADDGVTTISGGTAGDILILKPENLARTITLGIGGNIYPPGNKAFEMDYYSYVILIYDGSYWRFWGIPSRTGIYRDVYIDAGAMISCTTNGAEAGTTEYTTNDIDMDYFAFDSGATEERVQLKLSFPDEWDRSSIKIKLFWSSATGSTTGDTVEWGVKIRSIRNDDAIDGSFGSATTVSDALTADNGADLQVTDDITLSWGGVTGMNALVIVEIYRNTDGTDDMSEDAWLFGIEVQYKEESTEPAQW